MRTLSGNNYSIDAAATIGNRSVAFIVHFLGLDAAKVAHPKGYECTLKSMAGNVVHVLEYSETIILLSVLLRERLALLCTYLVLLLSMHYV